MEERTLGPIGLVERAYEKGGLLEAMKANRVCFRACEKGLFERGPIEGQ